MSKFFVYRFKFPSGNRTDILVNVVYRLGIKSNIHHLIKIQLKSQTSVQGEGANFSSLEVQAL